MGAPALHRKETRDEDQDSDDCQSRRARRDDVDRGVVAGVGRWAHGSGLASAAGDHVSALAPASRRAQPKPNNAPQNPFHDGPPIEAADPTHVDPVELLPQARKIAVGLDRHAVLTRIFATKRVTAGTVDVTGDVGVTFEFEWLYFDKSRPPDSDKVENGLWAAARHGRFSVTELHRASVLSRTKAFRPDPAPDPPRDQCRRRNRAVVSVFDRGDTDLPMTVR